jgi:hypothetical protein
VSVFTKFLDALNSGVLPRRDITPTVGNDFADQLIDRVVSKTFGNVPGADIVLWMLEHAPPLKGTPVVIDNLNPPTLGSSRTIGNSLSGEYSDYTYDLVVDNPDYFVWTHLDVKWHWVAGQPGGYYYQRSQGFNSKQGQVYDNVTRIVIEPYTCKCVGLSDSFGCTLLGQSGSVSNPRYTSGFVPVSEASPPAQSNTRWNLQNIGSSPGVGVPRLDHPTYVSQNGSYHMLGQPCKRSTIECVSGYQSPPRPNPRVLRALPRLPYDYLTVFSHTDSPSEFRNILLSLTLRSVPMNSFTARYRRQEGEIRQLFGDTVPPVWYSQLMNPGP